MTSSSLDQRPAAGFGWLVGSVSGPIAIALLGAAAARYSDGRACSMEESAGSCGALELS